MNTTQNAVKRLALIDRTTDAAYLRSAALVQRHRLWPDALCPRPPRRGAPRRKIAGRHTALRGLSYRACGSSSSTRRASRRSKCRGDRVAKIISDTCQTSSFSSMTIGRLFEISERVEQAPTCYADAEPCACRQMRIGKINYDTTFGYPLEINLSAGGSAELDTPRLLEAPVGPSQPAQLRADAQHAYRGALLRAHQQPDKAYRFSELKSDGLTPQIVGHRGCPGDV